MSAPRWMLLSALALAGCGKPGAAGSGQATGAPGGVAAPRGIAEPSAGGGPGPGGGPGGGMAPGQPAQIGTTTEDTSAKQPPRLLPQEVYIRSYLHLFGGLSPLDTQKAAQGQDGSALFDTWTDYLTSLGMPDYYVDIPRATQTNTLMLATFERMGIALCDRAVERDLIGAPALDKRVVFAFDVPPSTELDAAGFASRFDTLHRTFLGYPAKLAPGTRTADFFELYRSTVEAPVDPKAPMSRFTPPQAGWATVCYGLARHPEFHTY